MKEGMNEDERRKEDGGMKVKEDEGMNERTNERANERR